MAEQSTAEPKTAPTVERSVVQLNGDGLVRVGARPGLGQYIKQLWSFRHFLIYDSRSRVSAANSFDSMGRIWMVGNPLLMGMAYFSIFGILLGTGRGIPNFIGYLVIGVFTFRFFTSAVSSGANSILSNRKVVHAFNFPRAALPISACIRELLSSIPVFVVMAALVLTIGDIKLSGSPSINIHLTWNWLLFFPVITLALMVMVGWSLALARAVNAYPDVKHMITFGTRVLFYSSAVLFSLDRWSDAGHEWLVQVMYFNPLFCVLDIIRDAWLYEGVGDPFRWIVLGSWAVGSVVVGFVIFWRGEETYGRER